MTTAKDHLEEANAKMEKVVKTTVEDSADGRTVVSSIGSDPESNIPEALKEQVLRDTKGDLIIIFSVNDDGVSIASLSKEEGIDGNKMANMALALLQQSSYLKELLDKMEQSE